MTYIQWSSDEKKHEKCGKDYHVFTILSDKDPENKICNCGKAKWIFVKCEHCGQKTGKAVLIDNTAG